MSNIRLELEKLESEFNEVNRLLSENLVIDDKKIEEDSVYYIINTNREIIKELYNLNI